MSYIKAKEDGYSATKKRMSASLNRLYKELTTLSMFTEGEGREGREEIEKLRRKLYVRLHEEGKIRYIDDKVKISL